MPPCRRVSSPSPTRRQHDATVSARPRPIARPTNAHRPHRFLATGNRQLATIHWPLQSRNPEIPSRRPRQETPKRAILQGRARTQPGWTQRAASHTCPPTMPGPPTMPTCSEQNVRNQPPAHIAPGAAATNRKCSHLPSAAPPMHSGTKPAMPSMPAPPTPGSVSCHKEHAAETFCALSALERHHFAHFQSKTDRKLTASASCYESPYQYPVTRTKKCFSKSGPSGQIYTIRYPIDTLPIPDFPIDSRPVCVTSGRSWANIGQNRTLSRTPARRYRQGDGHRD